MPSLPFLAAFSGFRTFFTQSFSRGSIFLQFAWFGTESYWTWRIVPIIETSLPALFLADPNAHTLKYSKCKIRKLQFFLEDKCLHRMEDTQKYSMHKQWHAAFPWLSRLSLQHTSISCFIPKHSRSKGININLNYHMHVVITECRVLAVHQWISL